MKKRIRLIMLGITILVISGANASQILEIQWNDLKKKVEFEDPFTALTKDQLHDLSLYANMAARRSKDPAAVTANMELEVKQAEVALRQAGIDIEFLLNKRTEIMNLRKQAAYAVVPDLDGEQITMPGYALPLEYTGKKITEFLLVPWVGACIHTPPPPPNQIVHVTLDEGFESVGQFTPVWISGEMKVVSLQKNLYLKDGSGDIDVGYQLTATEVKPYNL